MKTKEHFLNAIPEIVGWFAIVAGLVTLLSMFAAQIVLHENRTPGFVLGGVACLAFIYFGIRVVIKASKVGAVDFFHENDREAQTG